MPLNTIRCLSAAVALACALPAAAAPPWPAVSVVHARFAVSS